MMRLRKRNARLFSASEASKDQLFSRFLNLRRSVWPPVAFVICLAVLGLANARRRPRGSRGHTDSGGVHLTPIRRCASGPSDTFDWFRNGHGSSREGEKSDPANSRLRNRSFSDSPADLTMYYRIDSLLLEEDVNSLPLQRSLQRQPVQPHLSQLGHKQQISRAVTV
mmetsp:Transcript_43727/g.86751  ORF Transcript_43727/g.86751 Transcript_43727/m.86751 type:complete len:167 (-) Transcript_43727:47-547(-)